MNIYLNGYKTYISGALIILFSVLFAFGLMSQEIFLELLGILLGAGAISLRHAVSSKKL